MHAAAVSLLAAASASTASGTADAAHEAAVVASGALPNCKRPKLSANPVHQFTALLSSEADPEQARACLLRHLVKRGGHASMAAAWALAAAALPATSAPFLARSAELLRGKRSQRAPASYDVLGPLPIGKNEVDGDPAAAWGGSAFAHWLSRPHDGRVSSELVPGGAVEWRATKAEPSGVLRLQWAAQPWGALVQSLGQRAVLEWQAWAIGVVAVASEGHYRLDCKGVHKVTLRSALHAHRAPHVVAADIYSSDAYGGGGFGVGQLRPGAYIVAMRVRGVVQASPSCALLPAARDPMTVSVQRNLPDLVRPSSRHATAPGRMGSEGGVGAAADAALSPALCGGYVGLAIRNSGAAGWLRNVSVRAQSGSEADVSVADVSVADVSVADVRAGVLEGVESASEPRRSIDVAPGQLRIVPVRVELRAHAKVACPFSVSVEVTGRADGRRADDDHQSTAAVTAAARIGGMACREPSQSVVCTFIDHDGAVSAAAVLRPLNAHRCDRRNGCPVLLSLHGTSRPVRDSADAYKFKPPTAAADADYTFGVERFWLVAPTRHGAHNWEEGGRLTAMHSIEALSRMASLGRLRALSSYEGYEGYEGGDDGPVRLDSARVLYAGHSMGGHGAWLAAVQGASRALGVAAVSGWTKKETYGDSNFLFDQVGGWAVGGPWVGGGWRVGGGGMEPKVRRGSPHTSQIRTALNHPPSPPPHFS